MLGRLKHSLKERCPVCGHVLQLRVIDTETMHNGIEILVPEEYVCCSNRSCYYEREVPKKKRKRRQDEF